MKAKEMILSSLAALLAGCFCTTISDEYSVADPGKTGHLRYEKVDDLDSVLSYSADCIPVVVKEYGHCWTRKEIRKGDRTFRVLRGVLCVCTLGIFPYWETDERSSWQMEVKSPVGTKSGTCTRTRQTYWGWIPYMLPFSVSDSEVKFDPTEELTRRVVGQLKSEWTEEKVVSLNVAEKARIDAKRKRAEELLAAKDWTGVLTLCADEKDNRLVDEYKGKLKDAEKKQLTDTGSVLAELAAKNEYDKAEKLLSEVNAKWANVDGHDSIAWENLRVANHRKRLEWMMAQNEKRKGELEQLLKAGKFDDFIAACEKEAAQSEGANRANKVFWLNCKMMAARKRAEATITAIHKELETRLQPQAEERIAQVLALAKKSAGEGNINFFGFFVGMSQYDAFALARHYGLDEDQYSIAADGQGTVNVIWISLKGIRRLAKKGNTFQELYRVVEPLVGDMSFDTDSAFNEAFDSSLAAVFSFGQKRPSVPKAKYVRETIDGVVARMFDGAQGGLTISQKNPKTREPIATESAKLEYEANQEVVKTRKNLVDLQEAEYERVPALEILNDIVSIPGKNFKMGKYEVTQKQWMAIMGNNPLHFKGKDRPVENVSWNDCKEFLERLNALPDVKCSGLTFRLPTEKEWEYACRAGSTGDYCKLADGTEITKSTLGEVAWYDDNSKRKTHPVGQKKPNAFGLYDMHGNVWEWCEDLYRAGDSHRVGRGGGWDSDSGDCRASNRLPGYRYYRLGFRLAAFQDVNR